MSYLYDPRSRRYRHEQTGRYVSFEQVRVEADRLIDASALTMRQHAQDLIDGKINFAEWQLRSLATIKQLHMATALAANGGKNNTSPSDQAYMANLMKEQYQYFRNMVADIRKGEQKLDGTLLSRVALYAQSSRRTHELVKQRSALLAGLKQERSVLGRADHCNGASNGCVEQAKRGWVPIGTLVMIGERICGPNCRCSIQQK